MAEWSFLTNHARALVCIARDPGVRLRDIAAALDITERTAFGIVTDLTEAGYVVKDKDGRRNRYRIQDHLPLPDAIGRERTIGEVLGLLIDTRAPESAQLSDGNAASDGPAPRQRASLRRRRSRPAAAFRATASTGPWTETSPRSRRRRGARSGMPVRAPRSDTRARPVRQPFPPRRRAAASARQRSSNCRRGGLARRRRIRPSRNRMWSRSCRSARRPSARRRLSR